MTSESENNQPDDDEASYIAWEKQNIISDTVREEIETMWEIPQICHFFYEAKDALNLPSISIYEVERMLLMPKASRQLAAIMTCLLCSPNMKSKLRKIPSMPYKFWTHTLLQKYKHWFKIYQNKHQDAVKVLETIGVEPMFWKIFPDISHFENTTFENLTLKEKVWLLKTLCDTLMHTRKTIQDEIVKHSDEEENEMVLGTDRHGNTYFYLNQFLDTDVRVYRHNMINNVYSAVQCPTAKLIENSTINDNAIYNCYNSPFHDESSNYFDVNITSTPILEQKKTETSKVAPKQDKPRRKKGWKNGILPNRKKKYRLRKLAQANLQNQSNGTDTGCPTDESRCSSSASFCLDTSLESQNDQAVIRNIVDTLLCQVVENETKNAQIIQTKELDDPISLLLKNSECSLISVKKRKSDKDNEAEQNTTSESITINKLSKSVELIKTDEKLTNVISYSNSDDKDMLQERIDTNDKSSENSSLSNIFEKKDRKDFWNVSGSLCTCKFMCDNFDSEEKLYEDYFSVSDIKKNDEYWQDHETNIDMDQLLDDIDVSEFDLVADSVESLRDFIAILATEHLESYQKKNKCKIACEHKLLKNLCLLAENLEEKEESLKEAMSSARRKLCKELINFRKGIEEDSTWQGENGITFNWWIVGAQNFNFTSLQDSQNNCIEKSEKKVKHEHDTSREHSPSNSERYDKNDDGKKNDNEDEQSEGEKQKNTRVLRTRGISSYTGHFYSDEDSDDHDISDRWAVVDTAVQDSTISNMNSSADSAQMRRSDSQSEQDSDQEWILPKNRKKKKKRQSASRRFKSFQHKIQIIPVNSILENAGRLQPNNFISNNTDEHSADETKPDISKIQIYPSPVELNPMKKELERVDSIHSELDIPEEKPVIDPLGDAMPNQNVPAPVISRQRNNIPVIASNIAVQPFQFAPQYRQHIRHQVITRPLPPHALNAQYRGQQIIHRPRMYRGSVVPTIDPRLLQPRGVQMAQSQIQMAAPRRMLMDPRGQIRMPPRAQQPRAYRPMQMPVAGQRMRAPIPAIPNTRATYNPRNPQMPQMVRQVRPQNATPAVQKGTSCTIVLSDSDDEIEMIVIEKSTAEKATPTTSTKPVTTQARTQKPVVTSQVKVTPPKSALPTQMLRRMNQGGISITPLKQAQAAPNRGGGTTPQLVVVVNETGSHYALALPNGSKLILTPEQVAQIRASNGGNLSL